MMWMNEYEIEEAVRLLRSEELPNLLSGALALRRLMVWVNSNSDGWCYWQLPSRAATRLQAVLQDATRKIRFSDDYPDITRTSLTSLLRPIRKFLSEHVEDADAILNPPPPPPVPSWKIRGETLPGNKMEATFFVATEPNFTHENAGSLILSQAEYADLTRRFLTRELA